MSQKMSGLRQEREKNAFFPILWYCASKGVVNSHMLNRKWCREV